MVQMVWIEEEKKKKDFGDREGNIYSSHYKVCFLSDNRNTDFL